MRRLCLGPKVETIAYTIMDIFTCVKMYFKMSLCPHYVPPVLHGLLQDMDLNF